MLELWWLLQWVLSLLCDGIWPGTPLDFDPWHVPERRIGKSSKGRGRLMWKLHGVEIVMKAEISPFFN